MVKNLCPGRGGYGGRGLSGVTRGQKVEFWVLFFYCHPSLRLFSKNLETITGNNPMNEDWRNAFGILMCREICDSAGAGISDGAPSTCSSCFFNLSKYMFFSKTFV